MKWLKAGESKSQAPLMLVIRAYENEGQNIQKKPDEMKFIEDELDYYIYIYKNNTIYSGKFIT